MCQVVKGTFRSYASLFTNTRSPSRIVGFIEPVGTSFQSASEDRMEKSTSVRISSGRISLRHQRRTRTRSFEEFMEGSTTVARRRSMAKRGEEEGSETLPSLARGTRAAALRGAVHDLANQRRHRNAR